MPPAPIRAGRHLLVFDRPLIMGVINVTPNSFSPGHSEQVDEAVAQGLALWRQGADILDIGGEATNPRAAPVSAEVEEARVLPVVRALATATEAVLSVDTTKATVARAAVEAGASIINDVAGGRFDPEMVSTAAALARANAAAYICGHLRGSSLAEVFAGEASAPSWQEVVRELGDSVCALPPELREVTIADPCLGFGKGAGPGNLELLRRGRELSQAAGGAPVLIGPSRKRFLRRAAALGDDDGQATLAALDAASVGACLAAVAGGASVVRVHNVALLRPALAVYIRE